MRSVLFTPSQCSGYSESLVEASRVKATILNHPEFRFFLTYYAKSIAKVVKSIEQICQNVNQVLVRLDI